MFRLCLAALAFSMSCSVAGTVAAFEDYTGRWGGKTSFYGQLSPSYIHVDDGIGGQGAGVDNSNSNSRIGALLRRPLGNGEFRFRFETGFGLRQSKEVSQTYVGPVFEWTSSDIRFLDFSWERGPVTWSIGQGSMATDNVAQADLSGTVLVGGVSVPDMAGGFLFRTSAGTLSGVSVNSAYKSFDGIRRGRVRHDRKLGDALVVSVSAGFELHDVEQDQKNVDAAVTYRATRHGFQLEGAAGASVTRQDNALIRNDIVGSFSALHVNTGLSLTVAAGAGTDAERFAYFKLGYQADLFAAGKTAVSADIYLGDSIASPGSRSRAWGLAVVQHLPRPDIEFYLGLRKYRLSDVTPTAYRDLNAVQFGTRWQF